MVALFVIGKFLFFLLLDYFIQRAAKKREVKAEEPARSPERFLIPRGYFFTQKHSWLEVLGNGNARVGIDDFVQKVVGKVDNIAIAPLNSVVKKGQPIMTFRHGDRTLSCATPVSGKVVHVNEALLQSPDIVQTDPYVAGWIAVVEPENLSKEIREFTIADEAAQWLRREVTRFREFISARNPQIALAGATMLDGGVPVAGALQNATESDWKAFEEEFLLSPQKNVITSIQGE